VKSLKKICKALSTELPKHEFLIHGFIRVNPGKHGTEVIIELEEDYLRLVSELDIEEKTHSFPMPIKKRDIPKIAKSVDELVKWVKENNGKAVV